MNLVSRIEAIRQRAAARAQASLQASPVPAPASAVVVQLPLWPEPVRAVPNGFLRSALFGVIRRGRRRYLKAERIAAVDGIEVLYTGERLDQGDLDVWESVLHAVRSQPLGNKCRVTSYALLKLMGKTDTGKNRATLHERILRLRANAVEVRYGRYTYIGGLIDEAYKDEATQEWVIVLNPRLQALYGPDQYTQVEWSVRHELNSQPLAQWLHGFYSSHAEPYPMKVETLRRLCGSEAARLRDFRAELRDALAELDAATGWQCSIDDDDLVHVLKTPTPSQARHLVRRRLGRTRAGTA